MKWTRLPTGPIQTNAYIVENDQKRCVIIDPGGEGERINEWLAREELVPEAILLTHAHFDHIGAVDEVRDKWKIPVYLHKNEQDWLTDSGLNGSKKFGLHVTVAPADYFLTEEQNLQIESFSFLVLETPGHSPGSVSYYVEKHGLVFSGDALFYQSIGRTDLYGGSHKQLLESIHQKLLTLPEDTIVLSGHGQETTIAQEMDHNPFLNGF